MIDSSAESSRRTLLSAAGAGLAGTGALLIAGCGSSSSSVSRTQANRQVPDSDVRTLNRLLDLERLTIAAYTAGIPLLEGPEAVAAKRFLGQELTHAGELAGLLREAGVKPRKPGASYNLGHPRSSEDILRLLRELESAQLAAYLDAIGSVTPGKVRAALAAVASNDAQHLSVVRAQLGESPVPSAFVTGRE